MLSVVYAECHISALMLSVVMLNVVILSVVKLRVMAPNTLAVIFIRLDIRRHATFSITTLSIMTPNTQSVMLSVTNKSIMLSVIMLNVVVPIQGQLSTVYFGVSIIDLLYCLRAIKIHQSISSFV
jgi:hypothetical protein